MVYESCKLSTRTSFYPVETACIKTCRGRGHARRSLNIEVFFLVHGNLLRNSLKNYLGFEAVNSTHCEDIKECNEEEVCGTSASCTEESPGYSCSCPSPYVDVADSDSKTVVTCRRKCAVVLLFRNVQMHVQILSKL